MTDTRVAFEFNVHYFKDVACLMKRYRNLDISNKRNILEQLGFVDKNLTVRKDGLTIAKVRTIKMYHDPIDPFHDEKESEKFSEITDFLQRKGFVFETVSQKG